MVGGGNRATRGGGKRRQQTSVLALNRTFRTCRTMFRTFQDMSAVGRGPRSACSGSTLAQACSGSAHACSGSALPHQSKDMRTILDAILESITGAGVYVPFHAFIVTFGPLHKSSLPGIPLLSSQGLIASGPTAKVDMLKFGDVSFEFGFEW